MKKEKKDLPKLRHSQSVTLSKIQVQIQKGESLLETPIKNEDELNNFKKEISEWDKYNEELLASLFVNPPFYKAYIYVGLTNQQLYDKIADEKASIKKGISKLKGICERAENIYVDTTIISRIYHDIFQKHFQSLKEHYKLHKKIYNYILGFIALLGSIASIIALI